MLCRGISESCEYTSKFLEQCNIKSFLTNRNVFSIIGSNKIDNNFLESIGLLSNMMNNVNNTLKNSRSLIEVSNL